jgi:hypothetical protein
MVAASLAFNDSPKSTWGGGFLDSRQAGGTGEKKNFAVAENGSESRKFKIMN